VSLGGSCVVDAAASDNKVEGGSYEGQLSRMMKWSCHLAITESLSDSSEPSVNVNAADAVLRFSHLA